MVNPKRAKFKAALERIPKDQIGDEDILSYDLADKVGRLEDREKITIRLDLRVLDAAKREAEELGVGYQKIINDRLLEMYLLGDAPYLRKDSQIEIRELSKQIEELNKRLNNVERVQEKKQA
ncbi:MAG: hypothetical protein ACLGG0_09715 [Bacteriovoracia bacterium]